MSFPKSTSSSTLTELRRKILEQTDIFNSDDLLPVPCNPDALVMGYVLKLDGDVFPLTRYINPNDLLDNSKNTIVYEQDEMLQGKMIELFSTGNSVEVAEENLKSMMCCLPNIEAPNLGDNTLFRVIIMHFIDAYNFEVRALKKSCVHMVNKDYKIIPFETMHLFYRDDKKAYLEILRAQALMFIEANLDGLLTVLIIIMIAPSLLLAIIGGILNYNQKKKSRQSIFILAVFYFVISLGICGVLGASS